MNLSHEYNDETFDPKYEAAEMAQYLENEAHNDYQEMLHRTAPEGFDFYAQYE